MNEVLLTVEQRGANQYYVQYGGREFRLASPIHLDYESRPEWDYWLHEFRFFAIPMEEE